MKTPTIPGVSPAVTQERGYVDIKNERQLDGYAHHLTERQRQVPGMLVPIYRLGEPIPYTYVLRPQRPRIGDDGKDIKYEWPARVPLCLDVLPCSRDALADAAIPIWITEGAKKADALLSAFGSSIVAINLNGVWGWRRKEHDGSSHPLADFDEIAWKGREVVLAFDSDVTLKPEVQQALKALATMLRRRGAHVRVLILPDDGEKVGVDDALAGGMTPDELQSYIRDFGDFSPARRPDDVENLEDLDPDELRRRYRAVVAERDQWKQRAVQLEMELGQVQERNRFVTQATGANIAGAGKRLTLIELKKEIDTAQGDGRQDGEWTRIRPAYMGKCTRQDAGTISRHLREFEDEDWIERRHSKAYDPETNEWTSATFVRPKVDLSDPSQVVLPAKPRGRQACRKCGSDKLVRETKIYCADCEAVQSQTVELVNAPEAELQTAIQEDQPSDDPLTCNVRSKEKTTDLSELQTASQPPRPSTLFFVDVSDPSALPGVRSGAIAANDRWILEQNRLQALGGTS